MAGGPTGWRCGHTFVRQARTAATAAALCAFSLVTLGPACAQEQSACAGTGVNNLHAAVSIDLGDLTSAQATAHLNVGETLYVGSNSCEGYSLPASKTLLPVLVELSRHQQPGPGLGGAHTLDVLYRGAAPGQITIPIACQGGSCAGTRLTVSVTVT